MEKNNLSIGLPHKITQFIDILCCPATGESLHISDEKLFTSSRKHSYQINSSGIPLFAKEFSSDDAKIQEKHYDKIAKKYLANLSYPHTQEYMNYLDKAFIECIDSSPVDTIAEICCGRGEALGVLEKHGYNNFKRGIGIDISTSMLENAAKRFSSDKFMFVQGDATMIPLMNNSVDKIFILGGIHHVPNREKLFAEIHRILKPGGRLYWREPADDFFIWRFIRKIIYRISPTLDHTTEKPISYKEMFPQLNKAGLNLKSWKTYGMLGFCLFMNSDVLIFNRLFQYLPGIRMITRLAIKLDDLMVKIPYLKRNGLVSIGYAEKI